MKKFPLMRNNILREDLDAVIEHLRQDDPMLTNGPNVRAFEAEWSEWLGVKYSVFVNSGASANLVSMAMNGWGAAEPAWWLNLQGDSQAVVELAGGIRHEVLGRAAVGEERERLWQRWRELDKKLDSYAARRPRETAVVVLEPRSAAE